ncbi:glycosyltransferase [Planktomarina sp.]|uniref:glycosyltransferase family 2 protein n=1 Tax=Planktomarina sp. TaxID=2024851 RepID=UPI0032611165
MEQPYFCRHILEELGGWDAHNVTEDADLGIRLTRFGYHTELLPTVTLEEANCRGWPWIRQRSRWLKGYAVTWAVHMRAPKTLLRDLGLWQFFGVQLLFAGTLSQFLLAPVLWTFWLAFLALPHPLTGFMPSWAFYTLGGIYLMSEVINIIVGMLACNQAKHRHLLKWVPSLHFYFPLGSMAAYKGFLELLYKPFYWDKTAHGISLATAPAAPLTRPERPHHVSGG